MLVAVGSKNSAKIETAKRVFAKTYPDAKIEGIEVVSGVSSQPLTDDTTIKGAINRATRARDALNADFGIGFEGGALRTKYGFFMSAWCAVIDRKGNIGLGGGNNMLLPDSVAKKVFEDRLEISVAMRDVKAIMDNPEITYSTDGMLSNGLIDRVGSYEILLIYALGKFLSKAYHNDLLP